MDFSYIQAAGWKDLSPEEQNEIIALAFERDIKAASGWQDIDPIEQEELFNVYQSQAQEVARQNQPVETVEPAETNVWGAVKDIGKGLLRVPVETLASVASIVDDPYTEDGTFDRFIEWNRARKEAYINAPGGEEIAFPGTTVTRKEMREGASSFG